MLQEPAMHFEKWMREKEEEDNDDNLPLLLT